MPGVNPSVSIMRGTWAYARGIWTRGGETQQAWAAALHQPGGKHSIILITSVHLHISPASEPPLDPEAVCRH